MEDVPTGEQRKVQKISHESVTLLEVLQSSTEEDRPVRSHHTAAGGRSLQQEQWWLGKKNINMLQC